MSFIQPETIQAIGESIDIPKLSTEAARALAPDVEYRLREVIQEALKFAKHCKRQKLTTDDINNALRLRNVEPMYGFSNNRDPAKFVRAAGHPDVYFVHDPELSFDQLIGPPLPPPPFEVRVRPHWLIIDGVQPAIPENTPVDAPRPAKRPKLQHPKDLQPQPKAKAAPAAAAGKAADAGAGAAGQHQQHQGPPEAGPHVKPPVQLLLSKELLQYWDRVVAVLKGDHPLLEVMELPPLDPNLQQWGEGPSAAQAPAAAAGAPQADANGDAQQEAPQQAQQQAQQAQPGKELSEVERIERDQAAAAQKVAIQRAVIASLATDPGLHALGPHFSQLVASQASANLRNLPMLARLLEATAAMAANRAVDLGPYLAQLMPPVMTCLLARTLGATPSEDHWGLRQQAAQLLATLCAHYRQAYHNLQPRIVKQLLKALVEPQRPLATLYGAIVGLAAQGHQVVRQVLVAQVYDLMKRHIQPAVKDSKAAARSYEGWQCYQALVSAVGQAMYDKLVQMSSERLPDHLLVGRRLAVPPEGPARQDSGAGGVSRRRRLYSGPRLVAVQLSVRDGAVRVGFRVLDPVTGKVLPAKGSGSSGGGASNGAAPMDVDVPLAAAPAPAAPHEAAGSNGVLVANGRPQSGVQKGGVDVPAVITPAALLAASSSKQEEAMIREVLLHAWKEDSDFGLTLAALAQLFGEPFLAFMPSSVLPAAMI